MFLLLLLPAISHKASRTFIRSVLSFYSSFIGRFDGVTGDLFTGSFVPTRKASSFPLLLTSLGFPPTSTLPPRFPLREMGLSTHHFFIDASSVAIFFFVILSFYPKPRPRYFESSPAIEILLTLFRPLVLLCAILHPSLQDS